MTYTEPPKTPEEKFEWAIAQLKNCKGNAEALKTAERALEHCRWFCSLCGEQDNNCMAISHCQTYKIAFGYLPGKEENK